MKYQIFKGFKGQNLSFPGAEFLPLNFKGFKGVFKGEVKFKGFSRVSRVSRVGGHHAPST